MFIAKDTELGVRECGGALVDLLAAAVQRWACAPASVGPRLGDGPAVPIGHSVQDNYLICLETGAQVTLLARHLSRLGLTVEDYRRKWGLPADYPTAAPGYQAARRAAICRFRALEDSAVDIFDETCRDPI